MNFDPSQFGNFEFRRSHNGFSDFFNMFFGDYGINLDDLFGGRFSGFKTGYSGSHAMRGDDIETEIVITPEEGLEGVEKTFTIRNEYGTRTLSVKIPKGIPEGGR